MKRLLHIKITAFIVAVLFAINTNVISQTPGPFVEVIQPNATGIEWIIGQTYLISWTDNLTQPVNIRLINYDNNPATGENIIASATGSTYSWTIPNTVVPGNRYKIKIFSTVNSSIVDFSNHEFSIRTSPSDANIHVEQPNLPDITLLSGATNLISWTDNVSGNVKIELLNDELIAYDNASFAGYAGGLWGHGTNGGYGFEPWDVEYTPGTGGVVDNPATIGIIGMDNPSFHLESSPGNHIYTDRPFSAPLQVGSTFSFDWAVVAGNGNPVGSKGIKLYTGGTIGTEIISIKMEYDPDRITINGAPMFNNYGLNVMKIKLKYISAGNLRVSGIGRDGVESFNETISVTGAPDAVRFYTENVANMDNDRRIYFNNLMITTPDKLIATDVEGSTHYWNITSDIPYGDKFKIRVSSINDPTIKDESDNYFTIAPTLGGTIEVLQPNALNINWLRGNPYLISWIDDLSEAVDLRLLEYDGAGTLLSATTFASSVSGSTYIWNIPSGINIGSYYKLKIMSSIDNSIYDLSDNYFSISDTPSNAFITVSQPSLPNLEWVRGSTYLISWNDNIPGNVDLRLLKYNEHGAVTSATTFASNVPGSTYAWTIPSGTSTGDYYKMKIMSSVDNSIYGLSTNYFKILDYPSGGTIEVLQPNLSGIVWLRGHSYLISWLPSFLSGPVDIELWKGAVKAGNLASDIDGSTWVWDIPATTFEIGSDYAIKVIANNGASGVSLHPFALADTPGGTIEVLQPNGGEVLYKGTAYLISWIDDIPEPVHLRLLGYDGSGTVIYANTFASNVVGTTHIWNISSSLNTSSFYKMKIMSSLDNNIYDLSNGYFTITDLPLTFSVYPNPASDYFTVLFDEEANETFTVQLFNRLNLPMLTRTVNAESLKEYRISTADLPNGFYFLTISSDKTKNTQKIIVQH